jgi:hypothetical protein
MLLADAERLGVQFHVQDGQLHVDAPAGAVTPELRTELVAHKAEVLDLLQARFVILRGGLAVPRAALVLALELEHRGIPLGTDANHQFIVPDDPRLTPADTLAIDRWRLHLGAIIEYRAPEVA